MNQRRFFFQLVLITVLTAAGLFFLQIFDQFAPFRQFSFFGLVFFALLTVAIYFPAAKAAVGKDRNAFTRLVMVVTFVKMFLLAAIVIGYHRQFKPPNNLFLVPFFLTYAVFTVFETIVMSKLAKVKAR
jgi:hypothetical protein